MACQLLQLKHHQVTKHLDDILSTTIDAIVILQQPSLHQLVMTVIPIAQLYNLFDYIHIILNSLNILYTCILPVG